MSSKNEEGNGNHTDNENYNTLEIGSKMGEITTTKYTENQINEMVRAHKGNDNYAWAEHQTWSAIWINKVRIAHAFRRRKPLYGWRKQDNKQIKIPRTKGAETKTH